MVESFFEITRKTDILQQMDPDMKSLKDFVIPHKYSAMLKIREYSGLSTDSDVNVAISMSMEAEEEENVDIDEEEDDAVDFDDEKDCGVDYK